MIGGQNDREPTNSVQLLDIQTETKNCNTSKWRQGPPMNQPRCFFDAVACNGAVYAIGGATDTIQRIRIHDILTQHNTSVPGKATQSWQDLSCQLSPCPSRAGSTAVVKDRYIAIMTYQDQHGIIQVLDTRDPDNNTLTPFLAPSGEHVPRSGFTTVAVANKVYIIGGEGMSDYKTIKSVECIEFATNDSATNHHEPEPGIRPEFLSWTVETDLCLPHARCHHAAAVVGSKIVVAGGWDHNGKWASSIEVIDVERREIRTVPEMKEPIYQQVLLALPNSARLITIDRFSPRVKPLILGGDLGIVEPAHERKIHHVRLPGNEITCLQRVLFFLMLLAFII